jgi:hypothetical protein
LALHRLIGDATTADVTTADVTTAVRRTEPAATVPGVPGPMPRFTEAAEATLGRPVDAVVPVMRRHRAWFLAGITAYVAFSVALAAAGLHGVARFAVAGAAAGLAMAGLTRQHLLVATGRDLWLIAARPYHNRPDVLVGPVDRREVTLASGKFNDVMQIGETRYVLPRVFSELAQAVLAEPAND